MFVETPTQPTPIAQFVPQSPPALPAGPLSAMTASATTTTMNGASTSNSTPEIHTFRQVSSTTILSSASVDSGMMLLSRTTSTDAFPSGSMEYLHPEPDPQILEALKSKDRLYVLKLGEMMEGLISERRTRIDLMPATSYQRLLVHRCSAYYKLTPETDTATKNIYVHYRPDSRIPARRMSDLVPAEESAPPAVIIMRRGARDRTRGGQSSQPGSVAGEDADLSDNEPSETGSTGGRSNATGGSKRHLTIEEREAAYNEARSRIFMGFEEKERDMSANSSTFSLVSGSGSASVGDVDDSSSTAPTESEWSGPAARDKRDGRRAGGSTASSSRSMRSAEISYNTNGSAGSRDSRATSPAFTYASLYEPPPSSGSYDPSQYSAHAPPPGYIFYPPYPPAVSQAPGAPYLAPYPYYPPYYAPPHQPLPHHSDPATPAGAEHAYPIQHLAQPHMAYGHAQIWQQSPLQGPVYPTPPAIHSQPSPTNIPSGHSPQHTPPQTQGMPSYPTFTPAYNPYPTHGYYPPMFQQPSQQHLMAPLMQGPSMYPEMSRSIDNTSLESMNSNGRGLENGTLSRTSSRNSNGRSVNGSGKRGAPRNHTAWSYGPGVGMGGFTYNGHGGGGSMRGVDAVGPRLSASMRRPSGTFSSGSGGNRTPGDEASSTASSSTTSSSSRRTFTSTSSKHPLPPRPDWAVGLKAQPTLSHSGPSSRTMSPARIGGQAHLPPPPSVAVPALQATDFPPLSAGPEKRPSPAASGAWTNPSSVRSIMAPGPPQGHGTALVHYPNTGNTRPDEFERPPSKGNAELFNPKGARKSGAGAGAGKEKEKEREETTLVDDMAAVTVEEDGAAGAVSPSSVETPVGDEEEASAAS